MNDLSEKVIELYQNMLIEPNEVIYVLLFNACSKLVNSSETIQLGNNLLNRLPTRFRQDIHVITSAIHMLMTFGQVSDAENLFQSIKEKDNVLYGSMMQGKLSKSFYPQIFVC